MWSEQYENPKVSEEPRCGETQGHLNSQSELMESFGKILSDKCDRICLESTDNLLNQPMTMMQFIDYLIWQKTREAIRRKVK